jgi:hypothetical protein
MKNKNTYAGYRYPTHIIRHAVWLYHRYTLSFRDIEALLQQEVFPSVMKRSETGALSSVSAIGKGCGNVNRPKPLQWLTQAASASMFSGVRVELTLILNAYFSPVCVATEKVVLNSKRIQAISRSRVRSAAAAFWLLQRKKQSGPLPAAAMRL